MRAIHEILLGIPRCFGINGGKIGVKVMSISSLPVCVCVCVCNTYFETPALEFSTLLKVTEAPTMYVHASCT